MGRHGRLGITAGECAAVLLVAVLLFGGGTVALPTLAAPTSSPRPLAHPDSTPNGNLSIYIPEPTAPLVPGAYLVTQFRVSIVSNSSSLPPVLTVWVPQTIGVFYLPNLTIKIIVPALTLNFTEGGPTTSSLINATLLVKTQGPFNVSTPALLSSQLLAFMSNVPDGAVFLSVDWRWALAYPDGSALYGPWSPSADLVPAEYGRLLSYGPTTISANGWFQVCMASTNSTREYSLHLETISPVDDFVQVEQNVTGNATQPVCWSAQVASWVTPQPILAHVWAYDRQTFLLYLIKITVVNQTGPFEFLAPWTTWTSLATLGALAVAVGLVAWGGVRFFSARRSAASKPSNETPPTDPPR